MATAIDPDKIPYVTCHDGFGTPWPTAVDLWGIRYDANTMLTLAAAVKQGGQDTVNAWAKINAGYTGPDAEVVYNAMAPVGPDTETIASNLQEMCAALGRFADDVEPVLASLTTIYSEAVALKVDIGRFRPYVSHQSRRTAEQIELGIPFMVVFDLVGMMIGYQINTWDQDTDLVRRNNDLIARVAANVAAFQQAERDCANRITALFGGTQYVGWSASMGTAGLPGNVYGYGVGSLPTFGLPWGDPVDRVDSAQTKIVRFLGNMIDSAVLTTGHVIGSIVVLPVQLVGGMGPEQQKQALLGLYNLLATVHQGMPILVYDPATGAVTPTDRGQYLTDLGKSLVAWDKWGTDPGTAFGEAAVNIGSFIVPGGAVAKGGAAAKAGAGARTAEAAIAAERTAAASRVTAVARAAEEATAAARTAGVAGDLTRTVDVVSDTTRTAIAAGDTARVVDIVGDTTRTIDAASQTARTVDAVGDTARTADAVGDAARTADLVGDASKARSADTVSDLASPQRHPHPANMLDDASAPGTGKGVDAEPHPSNLEPQAVPRPEPGASAAHPAGVGEPGIKSLVDNLADHGIDAHTINPKEVTLAHIADDISHSPAFEEASTAQKAAADANAAAMEARNSILKDLQDNHNITINKSEIRGSKAGPTIDKLLENPVNDDVANLLMKLKSACDDQKITQQPLATESKLLGSAGGDDLMSSLGVKETHGGPDGGRDSFDKWGPTTERSEMVFGEEKGGNAKLDPDGRRLPDGTRAPQGSTSYFMDVAKHDKEFLEWAKDPANADMVQGLKDGTVTPRYVLLSSPGNGTTRVYDIVLNPDYLDWSWLPGGK